MFILSISENVVSVIAGIGLLRPELPAHQVLYAINDGLKKNFYDLINSYRVEEAKRLNNRRVAMPVP